MRIPVIAANWKMHKTVEEAIAFTTAFRERVQHITDVEIVIAPPFTAIRAVAELLRDTKISVAGQNFYWEANGAFTGEVSATMLTDAGATHAIVGHSERRQLFGETDTAVTAKVRAAFASGLIPIMCVGETLDEREANQTLTVLDQQVEQGLAEVTAEQATRLIVAYEPVWAIGTGRNATPAQAQKAHAHIRQRLEQAFNRETAGRCRVLYGGSVKPANVRELSAQTDVDGALVGGASLDQVSFAEIVAEGRPAPV